MQYSATTGAYMAVNVIVLADANGIFSTPTFFHSLHLPHVICALISISRRYYAHSNDHSHMRTTTYRTRCSRQSRVIGTYLLFDSRCEHIAQVCTCLMVRSANHFNVNFIPFSTVGVQPHMDMSLHVFIHHVYPFMQHGSSGTHRLNALRYPGLRLYHRLKLLWKR